VDNTFNQEDYDLPRFRTVLFGYSKRDIVDFLNSISNEMLSAKELAKENKILKEKAIKANADNAVIDSQKLLIAKALIDAQAKAKSVEEAADAKAKEIIAKAIAEVKTMKEQTETEVKSLEAKRKAIQDDITALKDRVKNA
jgi:cell division septum initiation protein DivIVA